MTDAPFKSRIDLNADLGEGFPFDAALLQYVSSANVCCGAHAGNADSIRATLRIAGERGVVVGAHPGYPDRESFGRAPRAISTADARALILTQVDDLARLADPLGVPIRYIKPHGALYNQAQDDATIAQGLAGAAAELALPVVGLPESALERAAADRGVRFVAEGFVDRGYRRDGRLIPRTQAAALHTDRDALVNQLRLMIAREHPGTEPEAPLDDSRPVAFHESWLRVESLCIHGDRPEAVELAVLVSATLKNLNVHIRSFVEF